jgi:hypothetical protein
VPLEGFQQSLSASDAIIRLTVADLTSNKTLCHDDLLVSKSGKSVVGSQ